jgi:hypothetical protein
LSEVIMSNDEVPLQQIVMEVTGRDIRTEFDSFETRLAFQKAIYLLQAQGAIPEKYPFNYYARGPYSPGWAKEGFAVVAGETPTVEVLRPVSEVVRLAQLHPKDSDWLEALATLHWYVAKEERSRSQARARAQELGKACLTDRFDEAWTALETLFPAAFQAASKRDSAN